MLIFRTLLVVAIVCESIWCTAAGVWPGGIIGALGACALACSIGIDIGSTVSRG